MAVPVRAELAAVVAGLEARRLRALDRALERSRQRLTDLCRALPRADALLAERRQRLDLAAARLARPDRLLAERRHALERCAGRLAPALRERVARAAVRLGRAGAGLAAGRLRDRIERCSERLAARGERLRPAAARLLRARGDRLLAAGRMLKTLGYRATLARGFAVVRDAEGRVLPRAEAVRPGAALDLQFADGRVAATTAGAAMAAPAEQPKRRSKKPRHDEKQGTLF